MTAPFPPSFDLVPGILCFLLAKLQVQILQLSNEILSFPHRPKGFSPSPSVVTPLLFLHGETLAWHSIAVYEFVSS